MINKESLDREQIIRKVTLIGNGAHVFAPKEWVGEKVFVIRTVKTSLRERILKILEPYLENILGVYIYGSYARGEQRDDSDIDLLVISNKQLKIKEKGFEIIVLEKEKISNAIKIAPVLIYSALKEAKPIINSELLNNLRKDYSPKEADFKRYIKETKNIIKINEELLDIYSMVLRLRGIYLIEALLFRKEYSYKIFKEWVIKDIGRKGIKIDFDVLYGAYLKMKRDLKEDVDETTLKILLSILKNKVQKLEKRIYG